ncbi:cbb3-type cytochrome c oxidase subunit I [Gracilimonas sp.]|uniref:cbb3-type cytochrome c oxidase subunit I n=1 Tax=Gracilimonas sp. TaxID=1974203 RepID=UPI002871A9E8|nr:cbb3-type cytochrome c oxidase subunit I [Gracilimonas sp.]
MKQKKFKNAAERRNFTDQDSSNVLLAYFTSGMIWLLVGSVLAILASFKLHAPNFLGDISWLTFGRVRPLHLNTMVYGWASMTGAGVALWLLTRTLRVVIPMQKFLLGGIVLWNIGLTVGSFQILGGFSRGLEWLEFPFSSAIFILLGLLPLLISALTMLAYRATKHLYISVYYIIAGFIWIFALLLVAYIPDFDTTVQAGMNWWYAHNALGLWFTPICLAAAYYLIPKVTGRPIYSYSLSLLGFWTLALFYNWNGFHHLIGGPVPTWATTISIAASAMMIIPVVTVAVNHHLTVVGVFKRVVNSPTLRFVVFGAMSYTFVSLQGSLQALRNVNEVVHFTHYVIAHAHIGMYAFVTMVLFGSLYYIMPRITGNEWHSKGMIKWHFWLSAVGIILYIVALQIGGIWQGMLMNNPDIPFLDIVEKMKPFLESRSFAAILLTSGHIVFAYSFFKVIKTDTIQENEIVTLSD